MSLHHHHIAENDVEDVTGYCDGCEKPNIVLVECYEGFHEYCAPCMEDKQEGDACGNYTARIIQRSDNGWTDA